MRQPDDSTAPTSDSTQRAAGSRRWRRRPRPVPALPIRGPNNTISDERGQRQQPGDAQQQLGSSGCRSPSAFQLVGRGRRRPWSGCCRNSARWPRPRPPRPRPARSRTARSSGRRARCRRRAAGYSLPKATKFTLAPLSTSSMPISTPSALRLVAMHTAPADEQDRPDDQVVRHADGRSVDSWFDGHGRRDAADVCSALHRSRCRHSRLRLRPGPGRPRRSAPTSK